MIVALAFCAKNKDITVRLMQWLSELGWLDKHDCILGVHADTDSSGVLDVAQRLFKRVKEFTIDDPETIYPFIANVMWKRCAYFIADINDASKESQPWFWLEPDAVPLVPEWLDWIEAEYKRAGKPFLLDRVVTPTSTHNSGTGVYPPRVRDYTHQLWNLSNVPWDVFFKDDFTPHTMHTTLIHDKFYAVWDDPKSGEPTFPNAASLAQIESGAVIFHRNKDGSLIARLRESRGNKVFRDANPGACVSQPTQAVVAREAIAQAPAEGSNPSAPATGFTIVRKLTEPEKPLLVEIDRLREERDFRFQYWEEREAELLARIAELENPTPAIDPRVKRLIDLRGFDAERMLKLGEERAPVRLNSTTFGTPAWHTAVYEIRKVEASEIPGINAGDSVLFSRVADPISIDHTKLKFKFGAPKNRTKKRTPEKIAADKARMAALRDRKAKKLTGVL